MGDVCVIAIAGSRTVRREATSRRVVFAAKTQDCDTIAIPQQIGDHFGGLFGVNIALALPRRVLCVHRPRLVDRQGDVRVARIDVEKRVGLGIAEGSQQTHLVVRPSRAGRLAGRVDDRPVFARTDLLIGARHHGRCIPFSVKGHLCGNDAADGQATRAADLETCQGSDRAAGIAYHGVAGILERLQDFDAGRHACGLDLVGGGRGIKRVHDHDQLIQGAGAGIEARRLVTNGRGAQHLGRSRGVHAHEIDADLTPWG